jgi:hypothetical protein
MEPEGRWQDPNHPDGLPGQQLFFYRDLWAWLDDPFRSSPALTGVHDDPQQLAIPW